ncbi:TRAP transporter, DctQ-like membrane protein [Oceaniovalibus guishaninsula JLT2003]|uniref:TRAP transporter small permease protein n=2 Tax=Oceaniovalibus TaxID=1207070 RepID=K2H9Q2_9RHOB|nr:TRAP transporter, DctQ-like membrane protein [Oceaniovalibus guishaninsula JLT2003]
MIGGYLKVCGWLDMAARILCGVAAVGLTGLVLGIVVLRYAFGAGFVELQDAATYAFAVLVAFSIPVCLAQNGHVRVEVLSERLSPLYRRTADRVALAAFLIPVFGLVVWAYWPELRYSWAIREASVETGGLGGLFVVKTALPVAALLTIVQGIAANIRGDAA